MRLPRTSTLLVGRQVAVVKQRGEGHGHFGPVRGLPHKGHVLQPQLQGEATCASQYRTATRARVRRMSYRGGDGRGGQWPLLDLACDSAPRCARRSPCRSGSRRWSSPACSSPAAQAMFSINQQVYLLVNVRSYESGGTCFRSSPLFSASASASAIDSIEQAITAATASTTGRLSVSSGSSLTGREGCGVATSMTEFR